MCKQKKIRVFEKKINQMFKYLKFSRIQLQTVKSFLWLESTSCRGYSTFHRLKKSCRCFNYWEKLTLDGTDQGGHIEE